MDGIGKLNKKKPVYFKGYPLIVFYRYADIDWLIIPVKLQNIVCDIPRGHLQTALAGLSRQQQYK